jgi:hypothetical protein
MQNLAFRGQWIFVIGSSKRRIVLLANRRAMLLVFPRTSVRKHGVLRAGQYTCKLRRPLKIGSLFFSGQRYSNKHLCLSKFVLMFDCLVRFDTFLTMAEHSNAWQQTSEIPQSPFASSYTFVQRPSFKCCISVVATFARVNACVKVGLTSRENTECCKMIIVRTLH